jgi:hypothetical protein
MSNFVAFGGRMMNNELKGVWKGAAAVQLNALSWHLLGEALQRHDKLLIVCSIRDSNTKFPDYKSGA